MNLVLDTNVLIAAFITHGLCNELLEHCAVNHRVVLSAFILDELRDKLIRKFGFSRREAEDAARLLGSRAVMVTPRKMEKPMCRDSDDDHIIGTAIAGNCECIVTGDKDLLDLQRVQGIRVVSPADFWGMEK